MRSASARILIRRLAACIWVMIFMSAGAGLFSADPLRARQDQGGGCTSQSGGGCASNYGTLNPGFCGGGGGSHCANCTQHEDSFCAPEDPCEVQDCVLDNFRDDGMH
jgi:hypothetical protein